jgi:hypothetical protein
MPGPASRLRPLMSNVRPHKIRSPRTTLTIPMLSLSAIWALPALKEVLLLLLGAVVSTVAKEVPTFVRNFRRVTPLLGGPWHAYHWSRSQGHAIIRHTQLQCRRSLYGVRIDVTSTEGVKSFYRGRVSFEGADLLLEFSGRKHTESFQVRMNEPIDHNRVNMVGVVLGMDFDRVKFAAVQICLRNEVTDDEAKRLIQEVAELDTTESSLRVVRPGDRARMSRPSGAA